MIFITLGSQKFQFNRLLKAMDQLCEMGIVDEDVFAQTGYSDYAPSHYEFKAFLGREEFSNMIKNADVVITHGGTGAIVSAVKQGKKVIAVPRLAKHGEHVDDHQLQIVEEFENMNLICQCGDCDELAKAIDVARTTKYHPYISNTNTIIQSIEKFIEGE